MSPLPGTLVVGVDGQIGNALYRHLDRADCHVHGTSRRRESLSERVVHLDLAAEPDTWPELPRIEVAVLCAGVTSLVACMQGPAAARRVNVDGLARLAARLTDQGTYTIFISSNQVFDGTIPRVPREVPTRPVSEYGRQKAATEKVVLARGDHGAVLRLSKVLSPLQPMLATWREALEAGQEVSAFANFPLAPVSVEFAIELLVRLMKARRPGIFQASGDTDLPYLHLAHALAEVSVIKTFGTSWPVS